MAGSLDVDLLNHILVTLYLQLRAYIPFSLVCVCRMPTKSWRRSLTIGFRHLPYHRSAAPRHAANRSQYHATSAVGNAAAPVEAAMPHIVRKAGKKFKKSRKLDVLDLYEIDKGGPYAPSLPCTVHKNDFYSLVWL